MAYCGKHTFSLIILLIAAIFAVAAISQCAILPAICRAEEGFGAENSEEMASYTTSFASSGTGRVSNIRLAAAALNGYTVQPGQELSFNAAVGERTTERGYSGAKVIGDGD